MSKGIQTTKRMFKSVTATWNPVIGCRFDCKYCWGRDLAVGKLKHMAKYSQGFNPRFFPELLNRKFTAGHLIFVTSMGDLFGPWVPMDWIRQVLTVVRNNPQTDFLLQTKNPFRFSPLEIQGLIPPNCYLGTTLETNRSTFGITLADDPYWIYEHLNREHLKHYRKFISIEPIMDFDLDTLLLWISEVRPAIVEVGPDNYKCGLPEPTADKVKALLEGLREICHVEEKNGLERMKG